MKHIHPLTIVLFLAILTVCAVVTFAQPIVVLKVEAKIEEPKTYATAYAASMESGKPLLVHLGTVWCKPCHEMQARLDRMGAKYIHVDCDADSKLAGQLLDGTSIPQLVIYFKVKGVWKHKHLIGPKSEGEIREFIK
jgi:thiol-disulfide isomerase/thioredoxin